MTDTEPTPPAGGRLVFLAVFDDVDGMDAPEVHGFAVQLATTSPKLTARAAFVGLAGDAVLATANDMLVHNGQPPIALDT